MGLQQLIGCCNLLKNKLFVGGYRDCHHPEMMVWQATQVPSRSMYLEGRGESFIPGYVEIGKKLKDCGCTTLCMCCNTAHYYIDELQDAIGLPFINLIEEVALAVGRRRVGRVGLMCSDGLAKVKFYDSVFQKICPEVEIVYPSEEYQKLVTRGICNAKNAERRRDNSCPNSPVWCFSQVVRHFVSHRRVDCVIAGCTDINNVFSKPTDILNGVHYIDSLAVLADCIASKNEYLPDTIF